MQLLINDHNPILQNILTKFITTIVYSKLRYEHSGIAVQACHSNFHLCLLV